MQTYKQLRASYQNEHIPYSLLLLTKEWSDKRESIINRDKHLCTSCGITATMPHFDEVSRRTFHLWFGDEVYKYQPNDKGIYKEELTQEVFPAPKPYILHVHHKFYIMEKMPWEYDDEDLITLCNWCHHDFHENNIVSIYQNDRHIKNLQLSSCKRCLGSCYFPEYSHVQNGICFRCKGHGFESIY